MFVAFYSKLILKQDSPHAWPQDAYRPRPLPGHVQKFCPNPTQKIMNFFFSNFVGGWRGWGYILYIRVLTPPPPGPWVRAPPPIRPDILWQNLELQGTPSSPPPVDRQTENITFPHTPCEGGNKFMTREIEFQLCDNCALETMMMMTTISSLFCSILFNYIVIILSRRNNGL